MTNDKTSADKGSRTDERAAGAAANGENAADKICADDKHKTEKLTKAGRDIDPDEGAD